MGLKAHSPSGFVLRTNLMECPMSGPKETHLKRDETALKVGHPVLLLGTMGKTDSSWE